MILIINIPFVYQTHYIYLNMKYIITESKRKESIEKFLKSKYPEVLSVSFKTKTVKFYGGDEVQGGTIQRTTILILLDTLGVTDGDFDILSYETGSKKETNRSITRKIFDDLKDWFGINPMEFASPWGLEFYKLSIVGI